MGHSAGFAACCIGQFAMSPDAADAFAWPHTAAGTSIKAAICQVSASDATTLARERKTRMVN